MVMIGLDLNTRDTRAPAEGDTRAPAEEQIYMVEARVPTLKKLC